MPKIWNKRTCAEIIRLDMQAVIEKTYPVDDRIELAMVFKWISIEIFHFDFLDFLLIDLSFIIFFTNSLYLTSVFFFFCSMCKPFTEPPKSNVYLFCKYFACVWRIITICRKMCNFSFFFSIQNFFENHWQDFLVKNVSEVWKNFISKKETTW